MLRVAARALITGVLFLFVTASTRGHLQAAGQRPDGPAVATAGQMVISEFRLRGAAGALDEFIEIQNRTSFDHTVAALSGGGYGIAASDGVTRCTIPNGTVIPARGHFLCVNSAGYSLGSYAAGNGTTATGDATFTLDIPDNAGIAIFNNNTGGGSYVLANRLDAVGSTGEGNTLYKEGAGYPAIASSNLEASFVRRLSGGCTGSGGGASGNCSSVLFVQTTFATGSNVLQDTNNNAFDFLIVDTNGNFTAAGQRLGAPGPENLSSPINRSPTSAFAPARLDTCAPMLAAPNKVRDVTSDPGNNSTFGTYELRRTWTNTSGISLTRLRFRIVDVSTFPSISGVADFRPRTVADTSVIVDRPPCGSGTSSQSVRGTTLETPPSQPNGSGYNGTLSVPAVTPGTPLANGASINIRFLLGIQQTGVGRFCVMPETLPSMGGQIFCFIGQTESDITARAGDIDFDQRSDVSVFNPTTQSWGVLMSNGGGFNQSIALGIDPSFTFVPVPGDYDGDGRVDFGLYEPATGFWFAILTGSGFGSSVTATWGGRGYIPVPGDYDGDGVTDIAVYSGVTGAWSILTSTTAYTSSLSINWGGPGYTPVPGQDVDGDGRSDLVLYNERLGTWYVLKSSTNFTTSLSKAWGGPGYTLVPGDYDGDGKADFGLYQRSTGGWFVLKSSTSYTSSLSASFGGMGFVPMPGDYDGDGKTDIGVYQLAMTKFLALTSSTAFAPGSAIVKTFGLSGDLPLTTAIVPASSREIDAGDFDGDFTSDLTVYNTTSGVWSMLKSTGTYSLGTSIGWGGAGYTPVGGDFDGDGRRDLAIYQGATGNWLVLLSSTNFTTTLNKNAGGAGYIPVPGDYDGDGKTDFVVYNTTSGLWFGLKSSTNYTTTLSVSWGGTGYTAAPGDFDGDGKQDLAIYNASTGDWSILTSTSAYTSSIVRNLGGAGYAPVPADFDGDGFTDFAVYQASSGMWTMLMSSSGNTLGFSVSYGGAGYTPVAGDWDGDGHADVGVYSAAGTWSILLSTGGYTHASLSKSWGGAGYTPVPMYP